MVTLKREESEFACEVAVEVQPDRHSQPIAMLTATSKRRVNLQLRALVTLFAAKRTS